MDVDRMNGSSCVGGMQIYILVLTELSELAGQLSNAHKESLPKNHDIFHIYIEALNQRV
jgi:hypothetical protein